MILALRGGPNLVGILFNGNNALPAKFAISTFKLSYDCSKAVA